MTTKTESLASRKLEREIALLDLQIEEKETERDRDQATNEANHVLTFSAAVRDSTAAAIISRLTEWHRYDPETPIVILLTSPGGYVMEGFGIYDFLRELANDGAQVETRVVGYAASMAGVLLQAGSIRSMSPNSYLMIHEVGSDAWGKTSEIRDQLELADALEAKCLSILAERSVLTPAKIRARCKRKDWWIPADEALKLGFVDVVK